VGPSFWFLNVNFIGDQYGFQALNGALKFDLNYKDKTRTRFEIHMRVLIAFNIFTVLNEICC